MGGTLQFPPHTCGNGGESVAVRIHATAIRDCSPDEARAVFAEILGPGFEAVPIHEHQGWTWFTTSVWGVSGGDLNKGLCRLARPALQFTTSDGSRWHLTVHGGAHGQEAFLHEFGCFSHPASPDQDDELAAEALNDAPEPIDPDLSFLEDEPEAPARPKTAFDSVAEDFAFVGVPLPEPLYEELRKLPYSQAVNRLRQWQANEIPRSLAGAGIAHDSEAMRRVLLWENITESEHGSDLGNLPRLLSVLGLGGEWDDYVRQAEEAAKQPLSCEYEAEEGNDFQSEHEPPADHARMVLNLVEALPLTAIEGGAVPLPPKKISRLGFPSDACSTWPAPTMAVRVQLPKGAKKPPVETLPEAQGILALGTSDGFEIGFLNRAWFLKSDLVQSVGKKLTQLLVHPPDGTVMEVNFAVENEVPTYQRFRGTVRGEMLWVEQSYPALTHNALAGAIEIAGYERKTKIKTRDEAEAQALEQAARRDNHLHDMQVKRKGLVVAVDFDSGNLAKLLLRLRYRDIWDFGPLEAHEAKQYEERIAMQKKLRRAGAEAARQRAAPHDADVLLKGRHSWYWRSDFQRFDKLDQEQRQTFDGTMTALGFTPVGDLVVKKVRDIMLHVFISNDRTIYGILMGKRAMYMGHEFVSRLSDGSGLTTTTNAMVESKPEQGIYYRSFPGLDPESLYKKHLQGLDRFRTRKAVSPVLLEPTLIGVAQEIELAFERQRQTEDQ